MPETQRCRRPSGAGEARDAEGEARDAEGKVRDAEGEARNAEGKAPNVAGAPNGAVQKLPMELSKSSKWS